MQPGNGHQPIPGMHRVAAPSTTLSRVEPYATQSAVPQLYHIYGRAYSSGGLTESPDPSTFPTWWTGSSFPGLVPCDDTVNSESVMGVKPGDSVDVGFSFWLFICIK